MGVMFVKETKTFLDGSLLWVKLEDPETGEIIRKSGKELDDWRKERNAEGRTEGQVIADKES